jgi:pimeloyl-ACP methyl ester carboxylesterase
MAAEREAAALATLAGQGFAGAVRRIEELHRAIAERSFRSPGAQGARAVHDTVASAVYAGVRGGARLAGGAAAVAARDRAISATPRGALVQSALNGFLGDRLDQDRSPLAVATAIRCRGRDVEPTPAGLRAAFPTATHRVVVFVHGLCEDENAWRLRAAQRQGTYATRLEAELGVTPVFVRYNTGLPIADSGRRLAELLERMTAAWPVAVRRIDLVGHSMGGLVGRAACQAGHERDHRWIASLRTTVTLGTPHHGAPLEQAVDAAGRVLRRAPESTPLAEVLDLRSAGIKDLRAGLVDVPLCAGARHYAVAATITSSDRHVVGRALGDTLVLVPSAQGRGRGGRRTGFAEDDVRHLAGAHHLALLNHPEVEALLVAWLGTDD